MTKEYKHHIGFISRLPSGGNKLHIGYQLSEQEHESYQIACKELREWLSSDSYTLMEFSFISLRDTYRQCADVAQKQQGLRNPYEIKLAINAAFLNFLSHARMYLDHAETLLKRANHASAAVELKRFEELTSLEFDSTFAYRFCYKLRNYALHCGFPISGFNTSSEFVGNTNQIKHTFEVTFNTQKLLKDFQKWGVIVKSDLNAMSNNFEVMEVAQEYLKSLRRVHKGMLGVCKKRLGMSATTLTDLANKFDTDGNIPHVMTIPKHSDTKVPAMQFEVSMQKIPLDLTKQWELIED